MATSEIEKLERRYAENPHGLTFAPLAEVHRKNGDVARALELLTAGLELHPNYIPASIVLGRCHQDLGDLSSAEAAFAHVLRLDEENVIALKTLADISEQLQRFSEAETWLRRLVLVDRSNDEAREQLRRVEEAGQREQEGQAEMAVPAPSLEMIDLTAAAESPEPASSPDEPLPVDIPAMEANRPAAEHPPTQEAASGEEAPAPAAPPPPGAAAETRDEEPQEPEKPEEPEESEESAAGEDTAAGEEETVRPLPGLISAEFQPPLEAIGGLGVETSEEVVLEISGKSEFRVPDASEDLRSLSARLNPPPPAEPAESQQEPAPVAKPESKREPDPELVVTDPGPAESPRRTSYAAADTKGRSVADFFRALVSARPPTPGSGAPERPASAGVSLSSVRGEESSPATPAVSAGEQKSDAAVSFDDFFNSESDGSAPRRHGSSDSGKDDLDQFQSWLQNLKR